MLFDTHVHLINRQRIHYPWLADAPALNNDASYEDYSRNCKKLGINYALHMEVDVAEDDMEKESDYIKELMEEPGSQLLGAIAACRPENDDFTAYLDRQMEKPWIKGFRRVLHVVDDEISQRPQFRSNVNRLSSTKHVFDICARADQLPIMAKLIDACPNVQFVLDHCGVPNIKDNVFEPWRDAMREIARRPNVVGKISGVIAYGNGRDWTIDDIKPYVEHTVDVFGFERIVWGSDSPVCTLGGSLASWVAATRLLFESASAHERAMFYSDNARRIWRIS